ncbi:MAG: hypothetical protein RR404_04420 [Bacilli bacterium]
MKKFNFNLPLDLFNRIELMAKKYRISKTKMMIRLLEIGYRYMLGEIENEQIKSK